jgi:predicted amidophosphoribosyltransferase
MKIDGFEPPLSCARCRSSLRRVQPSGLCHDCERTLLSAQRHCRPAHRPEDDESNPWQEIAIRLWEDEA